MEHGTRYYQRIYALFSMELDIIKEYMHYLGPWIIQNIVPVCGTIDVRAVNTHEGEMKNLTIGR